MICKSIQREGLEQKVRISASSKKWRLQNNFEYLSNTGVTPGRILQRMQTQSEYMDCPGQNKAEAFIKILKRYKKTVRPHILRMRLNYSPLVERIRL